DLRGERLVRAEHRGVVHHRRLQLAAQVGDAFLARTVQRLVDHLAGAVLDVPRQGAELGRRGEGRGVATGAAPEHEQVAERVRAQAVRAVQAGAGDLAGRVEAGQDRVVPVEDHVRVDRRGYAA